MNTQFTEEFITVGLNEQRKELDKLLTTDPEMEDRIRKIIRDVLSEARSELSSNARRGLGMSADPREAYRAIRTTVYRQILGGNVNILRKKKAGSPREMWLPSGHTGRGGNRRPRSGRTKQLQSYWGPDRGFILRFLNQGTTDRSIKNYRRDPRRNEWPSVRKWSKHPNSGNRGGISPRNWFGQASYTALQKAAEMLTARIEQLIAERVKA